MDANAMADRSFLLIHERGFKNGISLKNIEPSSTSPMVSYI